MSGDSADHDADLCESQLVQKPGSDAAVKEGCKCPIADNHHGAGVGGDGVRHGWFISEACELHSIPALDALLHAVRGSDGTT